MILRSRECFAGRRLHGVIGGFHLSGGNERVIPDTVAALRSFELKTIAAAHCTGWRALNALASAFGDAVAPSSVGKRYRSSARLWPPHTPPPKTCAGCGVRIELIPWNDAEAVCAHAAGVSLIRVPRSELLGRAASGRSAPLTSRPRRRRCFSRRRYSDCLRSCSRERLA